MKLLSRIRTLARIRPLPVDDLPEEDALKRILPEHAGETIVHGHAELCVCRRRVGGSAITSFATRGVLRWRVPSLIDE